MGLVAFSSRKELSGSIILGIMMISVVTIPLLLLEPPVLAAPPNWWNYDWPYRKAITINHTLAKADLVDFPVLIDYYDSDIAVKAQPGGDDIAFADSDGVKLSHEVELFENSTGHIVAWVKTPLISSVVDTTIYIYYGNPTAPNQQDTWAVWNPSYVMVHHFEETAGDYYDSTKNGNNGIVNGGVVQGISDRIDGVATFDGSTGYVNISHSETISGFSLGFTASFWVRPNDVLRRQTILSKHDIIDNRGGWFIDYRLDKGGSIGFLASSDGVSYSWWYAPFKLKAGSWYHVVVVWEANAVPTFYVNDKQLHTLNSDVISDIFNNEGTPLLIGKSTYAAGREFNGSLDEMRLSDVALSGSWILTSYGNQEDPSAFYTVGPERGLGGEGPAVFDEVPRNGSVDGYTNPTLSVNVEDPDEDPLTILFRTNASGKWETLERYDDVQKGKYSCIPSGMTNLGVTYYWSACVTDGQIWVNQTYSFTTTTTILKQKWMVKGLSNTNTGVLIADINRDGFEEVIHAGDGKITALNGTNGAIIWTKSVSGAIEWAQPQIADLDNNGDFEIVVPIFSPGGVEVLRAIDGNTSWRHTGLGGNVYGSPVIADIDGSGYPTIFVPGADAISGTGRLTALSYDGRILAQTPSWRPCGGGLSIADTDYDGEFELYMGDRNMYYEEDNDYGKGVRSFWARNLTVRWNHPDILCSSHIPMLADVNGDGILDVIVGHQRGGIAVLNSTDGSALNKTLYIPQDAPIHEQPSIYDVDLDGNLEILMADYHNTTTQDIVIWDLASWKVDNRTNVGEYSFYGPQVADLTGDGKMEIIVAGFNGLHIFDWKYQLIYEAKPLYGGKLTYAVVQDIDGDLYNELVISTTLGRIYAFDTPARRPTARARTEVQFYSERRLGAAEYVPPPGRGPPVIFNATPSDGATRVPVTLPQLRFSIRDYQKDRMNYTVTVTPSIGFSSGINVTNGEYLVSVGNLEYATTYTWNASVTDGEFQVNQSYTFTTETSTKWWDSRWKYRRVLTIDSAKVGSDETNFTVLIEIKDNSLVGKTQSEGEDLAFTDANNSKLNHEIEFYDNTTGHLVAWVKVPFLSSAASTIVYVYYGNPAAEDQQNPGEVWCSNFMMVQHLEEKTGMRYDSTSNGNNMMPYGGVSKSTSGKIDGADVFDGKNGNLRQTTLSLFSEKEIMIETWIYVNSSTALSAWAKTHMYGRYLPSSLGSYGLYIGLPNSSPTNRFSLYTKLYNPTTSTIKTLQYNVYLLDQWVHVAWGLSKQTNRTYFYVNGLLKRSDDISNLIAEGFLTPLDDYSVKGFSIGSDIKWGDFTKLMCDEVRVLSAIPSAAWIRRSYENQKDPSSFCFIDKEETIRQAPQIADEDPPNLSSNIPLSLSELSFTMTDYQDDLMNYSITTYPDIGSSSGINVANGRIECSITGLARLTAYVWRVDATDGVNWAHVMFCFATSPGAPPTQSDPLLVSSGGTDKTNESLICYNQTTYDPDNDKVTNTFNWYRNSVSMTNLLLPFDTNSSFAAGDYSGYGNDGNVIGEVKWVSNGKVGGAYRFERGHILIQDAGTLDGDGSWAELTIEHWVFLSVNQRDTRTIMKSPSYEMGFWGTNRIFAGIWVQPGRTNVSGYNRVYGPYLAKNAWYHIAMTYKSGVGITLYVNGEAVASMEASGNIQPSSGEPIFIGWFDHFKGMIDEVRIYPRSLSPQQVYQRYIETKDGLSNSSTIVPEETEIGDVWKCQVIPNDSYQDGVAKLSNTITIVENNPPTAYNVTIIPSTPHTNDNLEASYICFDPDGDSESDTEVRRYRNGILQPELRALDEQIANCIPVELTHRIVYLIAKRNEHRYNSQ